MKKRGMSKCFLILLSYSLLITVISVCLNIILPVFQIPTAKILPYALCFLYWDINSIVALIAAIIDLLLIFIAVILFKTKNKVYFPMIICYLLDVCAVILLEIATKKFHLNYFLTLLTEIIIIVLAVYLRGQKTGSSSLS